MANTEIAAIREALASAPRPSGMAQRRERLDALGRHYALPEGTRVERVSAGGVDAEWLSASDADSDRVVMFLHGGGYVSGSLDSHRHLTAAIAKACGARGLAIGYRLAPEHPFPAALDDTQAAYRWLLASGFAPGRIAVIGESAGGGLTVALLAAARDAGIALPACGWCIAPWVNLANDGWTMEAKAAVDPLIQKSYLDELAGLYLNSVAADDPRASPLHADLRGLPPLLVDVGSSETLLDDSVQLAGKAGAAEVDVRLRVWPEMIHAFPLFHPQLAEGREAVAAGASFIRQHMTR